MILKWHYWNYSGALISPSQVLSNSLINCEEREGKLVGCKVQAFSAMLWRTLGPGEAVGPPAPRPPLPWQMC
jgi:hypothetical protein